MPTRVPIDVPTRAPLAGRAALLLRELAGPSGIHASRSATTNYRAVFARDAVMAGVAGLLTGDPAVTAGLARTLGHLRDLQGPEGQIASNYEVVEDAAAKVSFGTLAPRIDGATWYLVGVALAARAGALDPAPFAESVRRVVRLLDALEYNGRHLVYIPAGGNWADEYVYDGYILYDQVLRGWALGLLAATYAEPAWAAKSRSIGETIDARYWPAAPAGRGHPLASVSPNGARDTFDLAACSLLALSGLAPRLAGPTLDWVERHFLAAGHLPPAFSPVIAEGDPDWPALRGYHLYEFRNHPHEYHNGGVWPIWLGWLALALAGAGRAGALASLRTLTARALSAHAGYDFEEYLHGRTGAPGGTRGMAYSATGLLFLELADAPAARALLAP